MTEGDGDADGDADGATDGAADGDVDGDFPSFRTERASRPLHLHLRAGAVLVCPGPAGDAG